MALAAAGEAEEGYCVSGIYAKLVSSEVNDGEPAHRGLARRWKKRTAGQTGCRSPCKDPTQRALARATNRLGPLEFYGGAPLSANLFCNPKKSCRCPVLKSMAGCGGSSWSRVHGKVVEVAALASLPFVLDLV